MPQTAATLRTLVERDFKGLNLSASPEALADGEFLELSEVMPYAQGNGVVVPGSTFIGSSPPNGTVNFAQIWAHTLTLSGVRKSILVCQLANGDLYQFDIAASAYQPIMTGTTVNGLSIAKWSGNSADTPSVPECILICDTAAGYSYWDGTTHTVVDATRTGQALTVYAGRVFIASGYTVAFTAPDSVTDFSTSGGGDSFIITDEAMSSPPVAFGTAQGWLYIIGPAIIALNNLNIPSGSTTPTWFSTLLTASLGVRNPSAVFNLDTYTILVTDTGVWGLYGLTTQRISQNMSNVYSADDGVALAEVYGEFVLVFSNRYCMVLSSGAWFSTFQIKSAMLATLDTDGAVAYMADGTSLYSLFTGTAQVSAVANTKLYDVGAPYQNKQVTRYGVEFYQSTLQAGALYNVKAEIQGFSVTPPPALSVAYDAVTANTWARAFTSFTDRYMSMRVSFTATPGMSIGAFFFEFQLGAPWP